MQITSPPTMFIVLIHDYLCQYGEQRELLIICNSNRIYVICIRNIRKRNNVENGDKGRLQYEPLQSSRRLVGTKFFRNLEMLNILYFFIESEFEKMERPIQRCFSTLISMVCYGLYCGCTLSYHFQIECTRVPEVSVVF